MKKNSDDKFYIYTIKGNYLLYHYDIINYCEKNPVDEPSVTMLPTPIIRYQIDLRKPVESQYMINSFEKKDDNSLFYQIRKCIKTEDADADKDMENSLSKEIIYVDFENAFSSIKTDKSTLAAKFRTSKYLKEYEYLFDTPEDDDINEDDDYDYGIDIYDEEWDAKDPNIIPIIPEDDDYYYGSGSVLRSTYNPQMHTAWSFTARDFRPDKLSLSDRIRIMFESGIKITYKDGTERTFVPFDKSASMARSSRICFINEAIVDDINKRLLLGIDFKNMPVNLSRYYAYRGLHLSSAVRVEHPKLILNKETVVVLEDTEYKGEVASFLSAKKKEETAKDEKPEYELDNPPYGEIGPTDKEIGDAFDGEGLISPKYANFINAVLNVDAASFQIRMPFVKGMLHKVDFKEFLQEILRKPAAAKANIPKNSWKVKDCFGQERDLFKAEIILTKSMFKGNQWLFDWVHSEESGLNNTDPMDFYFEKFNDYEHALHISGTDIPYLDRSLVELNYQFLNTLLLSKNDYKNLIKSHLKYANDITSYFKRISTALNDDENISGDTAVPESPETDKEFADNSDYEADSNDDEADSRDDEADSRDAEDSNPDSLTVYRTSNWKNALICNSDFIHEPYVESMVEGTIRNLKRDIGFGKLLTDGEIRYLSRDLLRFMTDIFIRQIPDKTLPDMTRKKILEPIGEKILEEDKLDNEHFYVPNSKIVKKDIYYPIFRSPHLSRNEQCALRAYIPKKDSVRDRYFRDLKGILMVSYDSFAPDTLGGADFDGDIVKIFDNKIIRDAVLKGVYDMKPGAKYEPKKSYKRRLPIIIIPKEKRKEEEYFPKDTTEYMNALDTFCNNIGRISNLAIQIGRSEYYTNGEPEYHDKDNAATDNSQQHYCAECSILTGLEIDACKTGVHPNLDTIFNDVKAMNTGDSKSYDYIKDFKTPFLKYVSKFNKYENDTCKEYFKKYIKIPGTGEQYGLNLLPYYYNKYCIKDTSEDASGNCDNQYTYFNFQKNKNWQEDLKNTLGGDLLNNISIIIKAYKKIIKLNGKVNRKHNALLNENLKNYIYTIFSQQYNSYTEEIPHYDMMKLFIKKSLKDSFSKLEDAKSKLKDSDWPYLPTDKEKREELAKILEMGEIEIAEDDVNTNHLKLLFNFNNRGYRLLYLVLSDCQSDFADDYISIIDICKDNSEDVPQEDGPLKELYDKLFDIYSEQKMNRTPDIEIKQFLISKCDETIQEQLNENPQYINSTGEQQEELKFKLIYQASVKAEYRDYFWSYYDFDTIKQYIYTKPGNN